MTRFVGYAAMAGGGVSNRNNNSQHAVDGALGLDWSDHVLALGYPTTQALVWFQAREEYRGSSLRTLDTMVLHCNCGKVLDDALGIQLWMPGRRLYLDVVL